MSCHRRPSLVIGLLAVAVVVLPGCQTPRHTDLLVFGTNTQFGVNVSADTTSTPGVNIGYRRQEVVLMPLYVNGADSKVANPPTPSTDNLKYVGSEESPGKTDTYSVFASFGASGGGGTTGKADVSLAQTFATGLAARTLAYAGASLVNTSDKAADAAGSTAQAAASAETKKVVAALTVVHNSETEARGRILAYAGTLPDSELPALIDQARQSGLIPADADTSDAAKQRSALKKFMTSGDDPVRLAALKKLADTVSPSP